MKVRVTTATDGVTELGASSLEETREALLEPSAEERGRRMRWRSSERMSCLTSRGIGESREQSADFLRPALPPHWTLLSSSLPLLTTSFSLVLCSLRVSDLSSPPLTTPSSTTLSPHLDTTRASLLAQFINFPPTTTTALPSPAQRARPPWLLAASTLSLDSVWPPGLTIISRVKPFRLNALL
jgi:hypothetical protein